MFKNFWFQTHWLLGIIAGLILAVMGVTGAALSYEHSLLRLLNPGVLSVTPSSEPRLSADELLARVRQGQPDRQIAALTLHADPAAAASVMFAPQGRGRGRPVQVDPYTGELLGEAKRGAALLHLMEDLHRRLGTGDFGRALTGASTLCLIVLALSGLYLRWPRRVTDWRAWLRFDTGLKGRSFLWGMHSVVGTWVLLPYLLMAATGLFWSYDWYRSGLYAITGASPPVRQGPGGPGGGRGTGAQRAGQLPESPAWLPTLEPAMAAFSTAVPVYRQITIMLPQAATQPVQMRYLDADVAHERASSQISVAQDGSAIVSHERYADKRAGERLMASIFPLHSGSFFGGFGRLLFMLSSLLMPLFAVTGWLLYLDRRGNRRGNRRQARRQARQRARFESADGIGQSPVLVAFASQSGVAEGLARQAAAQLRGGGVAVTVKPLSALRPAGLSAFGRVVFVVSTFGDGEPPDSARAFARRMRQLAPEQLSGLRYAVLALGDRRYAHFCGFGRDLDQRMAQHGAQRLFDLVEVDHMDVAALRIWRTRLQVLGGEPSAVEGVPQEPGYTRWILRQRCCLNPGSLGASTFHVELVPADEHALNWQPGDVFEIRLRQSPARVAELLKHLELDADTEVQSAGCPRHLGEVLAESDFPALMQDAARAASMQECGDRWPPLWREYSVASLPSEGCVQLLVRQKRYATGLGVGSAWLTAGAQPGEVCSARLRRNPAFRLPPGDMPLLLIGNGTGLAGLLAHLKARVQAGQRHNWLLFGERTEVDFYYREQIEAWQQAGFLPALDLVFSRQPEAGDARYVQHRLRACRERLLLWVGRGAVILVCGSRVGMAPGVDQALEEILGRAVLERLIAEGRYRRDVY